jgi:aspartokinase-like uncharacterized kinase
MDWIEQLSTTAHRTVVVPGGGPFADQVRSAQARWGFDDHSAHSMALLAMEQMARMLCALHPLLVAVADARAIRQALADKRVPVWLPSHMVLAEPAITADWSVTSDSLAAWLGSRLEAQGVLLVKSAELPQSVADITTLQRSGLLDAAFDRYARQFGRPIWAIFRAHSDALATILDGQEGPALPLAC